MDELRLTIIVPPLPALRPDAPDTAILEKHFVSYKTPQTTIQRLFSDLQREYANKYLPDSAKNAFVIKYLRDEYLCDLEYGHTLAYLFTGRKEPHCINVVPTWSNRESSLPVNSTLRPPDIAPLPPKRKILPPVPLFHEAEHKKRRIEGEQTDYGSLDPDRPLKSRERDLPDEGHLGSGFDREDDEERTLVADGGSADKVVRRGRTSSSSSVRHGGRQHTAGYLHKVIHTKPWLTLHTTVVTNLSQLRTRTTPLQSLPTQLREDERLASRISEIRIRWTVLDHQPLITVRGIR